MSGRERPEGVSYPDQEYLYYFVAEKFGWTPTEFDEQPAYLADWLIAISNVVEEVKAENVDKQSKTRQR